MDAANTAPSTDRSGQFGEDIDRSQSQERHDRCKTSCLVSVWWNLVRSMQWCFGTWPRSPKRRSWELHLWDRARDFPL